MFVGCERFFRPGYVANLVERLAARPWTAVEAERLRAGARVADIGSGHGASTILMAQAYPESTFTGSDYHEGSVLGARKRAADAGLADRVSFDVASAQTFSGGPYDLVTSFDCLHDMGDPVGAARHVREQLTPDGTWMVVEPRAEDTVAGNLNPVGRVFYSFSTFLCVPSALSQEGGYSLGAQAGEAAIRRLHAATPASGRSAGWPRPRSTWSTRPAPDRGPGYDVRAGAGRARPSPDQPVSRRSRSGSRWPGRPAGSRPRTGPASGSGSTGPGTAPRTASWPRPRYCPR